MTLNNQIWKSSVTTQCQQLLVKILYLNLKIRCKYPIFAKILCKNSVQSVQQMSIFAKIVGHILSLYAIFALYFEKK